jgi:hypothetical protein
MFLVACAPRHGTSFAAPYNTTPRRVLQLALDAAAARHYDIVAIDSPDRAQATFVAIAPSTSDAVVVKIQWMSPVTCGRKCLRRGTTVVVTPLAFQDRRELPPEQVPLPARERAEELAYAIFDRVREQRPLH